MASLSDRRRYLIIDMTKNPSTAIKIASAIQRMGIKRSRISRASLPAGAIIVCGNSPQPVSVINPMVARDPANQRATQFLFRECGVSVLGAL